MTDASSQPAEIIREFVIAGHGDLAKVKSMLAERPALLNVPFEWRPGDLETAIQGAAHVGNVPIAEYLLEQGAPLEICTAAMLGRQAEVERMLDADAGAIETTGAHGIPLLTHAALSGSRALVQRLVERGAQAGQSSALHSAVSGGHAELARWLLDNGTPDLSWKDWQDKTALDRAIERGDEAMAGLLRERGAGQ